MLVDADDGAVDQGVLEIGIARQGLEEAFEDPFLHPAAKAPEHTVPVAECLGQVAPGRPGPGHPEHRLEDQPVVGRGATGIPRLAGQQRRDPLPLIILQDQTTQG